MAHADDIKFVDQLAGESRSLKIADLGCGPDKFPGAVGVDVVSRQGIDIVHNLNDFPWPLESNSFDVIIANHLIEHVDDIVTMMHEVARVLKPGGYFIGRTPHYSHVDSYSDPTHRRHMTTVSFDYFVEGGA